MLVLITILPAAAVVVVIIYFALNKTKLRKTARIAATMVFSTMAALLAICLVAWSGAERRGWETNWHTSLAAIMRGNKVNHIIEKDYAPQTGDIVIYIRYGCPDCETLYDGIGRFARETQKVYIVGTRSEAGMKLRGNYPISMVPSAVLIGWPGEEFEITAETENGLLLNWSMLAWLVDKRKNFEDIEH